MKKTVEDCRYAVFPAGAFVPAVLSAFGRVETAFLVFAHAFAPASGIVGDYLRIAFHKLTLDRCSLDSRVQFGSFFAHAEARVGAGVYSGAYCVLGHATIGGRTQIASGVQILSGRWHRARGGEGRILGPHHGEIQPVTIGADCWIAAAIVMADVGAGSSVGAGSATPIPPRSVTVGNPARVVKAAEPESANQ